MMEKVEKHKSIIVQYISNIVFYGILKVYKICRLVRKTLCTVSCA